MPSAEALTAGILAAVFIYWGWDTAVTVNEETADSTRIPGRAAVISVVLLLVIYALVATSAQAFAGVGSAGIGLGNRDNAGDVLSGLGDAVFGSHGAGPFFSKLLILMVLTSAVASAQTTILPMARTVFSMAAHKAVPSRFARLHRRFLTPTWSTVSLGLASVGFLVLLTAISDNVLADSIESVGLAITFYYGLTGFACVWYFRRVLTRSRRDFLFKGLLPGLGALTMLFLFCYAAFVVYADPRYGATSIDLPFIGLTGGVTVVGLGALLLGVVLMLVVTREHAAALRLQRSLLPHRLPQPTAVEMASRYVPADSRSGVGGDWFDVIPLSGTRVGLVVGEVIGHGLLAAATMGRLRTGVRVLARLDLDPDELLSRLDDVVGQTAKERAAVHGAERRGTPGGRRPGGDVPVRGVRPGVGTVQHGARRSDSMARSSCRTAASPPTRISRRALRWDWVVCPTRPWDSSCRRAALSPSSPTGSSRRPMPTSTSDSVCSPKPSPSTGVPWKNSVTAQSRPWCQGRRTTTRSCSSYAHGCSTNTRWLRGS